ncbi:MAG: LysM peptidoglycan-binding domain-containing protein [Ardenticatenaceae bacterium]|nr:LysM peptidoglycan-binding domain-containing protein [Ardenticatenaceae bacterium]
MSESVTSMEPSAENIRRCPNCDSVVLPEATQCLMCGAHIPPLPVPEPEVTATAVPPEPVAPSVTAVTPPEPAIIAPKHEETPVPSAAKAQEVVEATPPPPPTVTTPVRRRKISGVSVLTTVFTVFMIVVGILIVHFQGPVTAVALFPSVTPIPPTLTPTSTATPIPTETPRPTQTPTITPSPAPTLTPQPPQPHQVSAGETLIGLSSRYRVSIESIAEVNGISAESPIQTGQTLLIPWPTPTPPLVPVAVEINGEAVIADPEGCERYQVQSGDSLSGIAARYEVDFDLFLRVNRLTDAYVLQPGDTLCIPNIVYGAILPPTPGPSPTPSPTAPLPGPYLLYPVDGTAVTPPDGILTLQWVAVKDLAASEWYMVDLLDLDALDQPAFRGFTRDTAFQLPSDWRPDVPETHLFRWRVSIVQVTGTRVDGQFLYTYGGEPSAEAAFTWLGAVPTPTPTMTPTPTATASPAP